MDRWLADHLVCPRDHEHLTLAHEQLVCPVGHSYPCVDGVPVMLLTETAPTAPDVFCETLEFAASADFYRRDDAQARGPAVDPYVQRAIGGTCGYMYAGLVERLTRYPIPDIRLPAGNGQRLLDIGCQWGRWSISASRKGYQCVGIDPSLRGILAARRVARQLGVAASFLVADARYLPFESASFDVVFSYSVLQHFAKPEVRRVLVECVRVLCPGGRCKVQMLNRLGVRNLYNQARQALRGPVEFDVRYWSTAELVEAFQAAVGDACLSVDGYFSANAQSADADLLPARYRLLVKVSSLLRDLAGRHRWLIHAADSLYVDAVRRMDQE